jgi:ankyrin repeat protein
MIFDVYMQSEIDSLQLKVNKLMSQKKALLDMLKHHVSDSQLDNHIFVMAVKENNLTLVSQMLSDGQSSDTEGVDRDECTDATVLYIASEFGHLDMVKLLLNSGADIEEDGNIGTPLMAAIVWKHHDVAKFLLDSGANINTCNDMGYTPLSLASVGKNIKMVKLLLSYKTIDLETQLTKSIISAKEESENTEVINLLTTYNVKINR